MQSANAHTHGQIIGSVLDFEVEERRLFYGEEVSTHLEGQKQYIDRHKALVRNDTDEPLAIVGMGYKTVQNSVLFPAIDDQIYKTLTNNELEGINVTDSVSYGGRVCIRDIQFPNMRREIGNSDVAFRIIAKTGFGGSSLQMYFGAISFFCMNGMISGDFDVMYARHTRGFSIANIQQRIRQNIDIYYRQADLWGKWVKQEITYEKAMLFFHALWTSGEISERKSKQLLRQFELEVHSHGSTVWALYNALTYYSSHSGGQFKVRSTGGDHMSVTLLNREREVRNIVKSDEWEGLALAA